MELQEAIEAYRERIKHVLSQHPTATDEWVEVTTDQLIEPFENRQRGGA
jgi:hypothetical protein